MTNILLILAAVLMLGIMVLIHECGHFFAARLTGIPVREFGIGFGPKLNERKSKKHETKFVFRMIPAGGYCAFYGEDDPDVDSSKDPRIMNNYPAVRRILTVLMGPVMNFLTAIIVAICFYAITGELTDIQYGYAVVQSVNQDSPAEAAGMLAGDKIILIDGIDASGVSEDGQTLKLSHILNSFRDADEPIAITIRRDSEDIVLQVKPEYDVAEDKVLMGIIIMSEINYTYERCSLFRAARLGTDYCVRAGGAILEALKNLLSKGEGIEDTGGPVRIIQTVAEQTKDGGFEAYIGLFILISVNLGLMNLLPIPGLDGSRLIFLLIEMIFRKPIPRKAEAYIHLSGYVLLFGILIILTYRDILHLFT